MSVFYTGKESCEWLDKYWTDSGNRFIATKGRGHTGMEVVFILTEIFWKVIYE